MVGFHRGLGEAGFAEGRNVTIEYRWAQGQFDRLPGMAADLVSRKVAVVICAVQVTLPSGRRWRQQRQFRSFLRQFDPVRAGFVSSIGHPGGNVTGTTFMGVELVAKRMELLHEVLPGITSSLFYLKSE